MSKALTPGTERKTMIITCNVALETQSTVKTGGGKKSHHSWLLMATAKHRKMHSTHWSNWENEALLQGAKNQCWLIQLKKLPLLHPLTYQLGLFCLGWKLSVNKISVAVMQGISSQRSDSRQEGHESWKRRSQVRRRGKLKLFLHEWRQLALGQRCCHA